MNNLPSVDEVDIPTIVGRSVARSNASQNIAAIDEYFSDEFELPSTSAAYSVLTFAVGFVALLFPLLYLALPIFAATLGSMILYHGMPHIRGWNTAIIVIGSSFGLFSAAASFIAPLLRKKKDENNNEILVSRESEPVLFHLIECCAKKLRVDGPDEIRFLCEPNASVESAGGKYVLNIGLSLASTMTAKELTGVVAHEIGHVRQGWARRFIFRIHSVITWFEDVVNQPEKETNGKEGIPELVRNIFLFFGLYSLKILVKVALKIVISISRQMELDADRVAATIVGKECFKSVLESVYTADAIYGEMVHNALAGAKELPDNLPKYAGHKIRRIPKRIRHQVSKVSTKDSVGLVHPSFEIRSRNISDVRGNGKIGLAIPGDELIFSFDNYAKRATQNLLVPIMGRGSRLYPTDDIVAMNLK